MSSSSAVAIGAAVPSLVRWGHTPDADLVFRTLATFGAHTISELSRELGMPARRVKEALDELNAANAVRAVASAAPGQREWAARPVADVIEAVRRSRLRLIPARDNAVARTLIQPDHQSILHRPGVQYWPSRVLAGRRLHDLMRAEKYEHLAMNIETSFSAQQSRAAATTAEQGFARGVRIRVIGPVTPEEDLEVPDQPDPTLSFREAAEVPLKLFVVDRRIVLTPLDMNNFERGYIEISEPTLVQKYFAQFERCWNTATDPWAAGLPAIVLSEQERELIELLAMGHTDISAAHRLQISARSVTNVLRRLMDRLSIDNRFQLGLKLGALRAVELPPPAIPVQDGSTQTTSEEEE